MKITNIFYFVILASSAIILRMLTSSFLPEFYAVSLVNLVGSLLYLHVKSLYNNKFFLVVFCATFTTYSGIYLTTYQLIQNNQYLIATIMFVFNLIIIPIISYNLFRRTKLC